MPSMIGGDNMSESYAPAAYLCGHFVGFDSTVSRWVNGYRYTFGLSGRKIVCGKSRKLREDGKKIPFKEVPDEVLESVLRIDVMKRYTPSSQGHRREVLNAIERRFQARLRKRAKQ